MQNQLGEALSLQTLLELALTLPRVELELNDLDQVTILTVFGRAIGRQPDASGGPPGEPAPEPIQVQMDFFGQVRAIGNGQIILQGPRFVLTVRTRIANLNNLVVDVTALTADQLLGVTPGPPDIASGSTEPTAFRVQALNPNRPGSNRTDMIIGHLQSFAGLGDADPHVELAGPFALYNDETVFTGSASSADEVNVDDFVSITARAAGFGEGHPVALEVNALQVEEGEQPPLPPAVGDEDPGFTEALAQEIIVEGFISRVDATGRFLALQGERFEMSDRIVIFGFDNTRITADLLTAGDRLELDTRPGPTGILVTRAQVIDPALTVRARPGVFEFFFERVDGIHLESAGPFFSVPADAEFGGISGLGDLAEGDFVRVAAAAPRLDRGETLPIAFRIRSLPPPIDPFAVTGDQGGGPGGPGGDPGDPGQGGGPILPLDGLITHQVIESFPAAGDAGIPTRTTVRLTLDGDVRDLLIDRDFKFDLVPRPISLGIPQPEANGRTISMTAEFASDTIYQLIINSRATGFVSIPFSTSAEFPDLTSLGSIGVEIVIPPELPGHRRFLPGESFAVLTSQLPQPDQLPGTPEFEAIVVGGTPVDSPNIVFQNIPSGDYFLSAFIGIDLRRGEVLRFDVRRSDPITVAEGEDVQVQLALQLPDALSVTSLSPVPGTFGVALQASIEVVFSKPALLNQSDIFLVPPPQSVDGFTASADRMTYTLDVSLREDTHYRAIVETAEDVDGGRLPAPVATDFATNDQAEAGRTITGRPSLRRADCHRSRRRRRRYGRLRIRQFYGRRCRGVDDCLLAGL